MEQTRFSFSWKVAIALLLAVLSAALTPMNVFADAKPEFISDMIILTASDGNVESAKAKLTGDYKDYIIIEDPIYKGDSCATFVAYKTTIDPDQAIVDVKAMHMSGGYSYEDYKAYLDNLKKLSAQLVDGLKVGADEARDNYEKDAERNKGASYAYNVLSTFYDDNTKQTLADLIFKGARFIPDYDATASERQASAEKEAQLVTIVMQGNVEIVEAIEKALMVACADGQANNFIEILSAMEAGSDTTHEYDTQIEDLIATLEPVQTAVAYYDKINSQTGYTYQRQNTKEMKEQIALQDAEIEQYMKDHPETTLKQATLAIRSLHQSDKKAGRFLYNFEVVYQALKPEELVQYALGQTYSEIMRSCKYCTNGYNGYSTLYDLIMKRDCRIKLINEENDDGEILSRIEGMDSFNVADFVPLMQALTPGQRGLGKVGFGELLLSVSLSAEDFVSGFDSIKELLKPQGTVTGQGDAAEPSDAPDGTISVYAGVDRSLFDPDGIAMTSDAINRKNGGDDSFGKVNMTEDQRAKMKIIAAATGGVALLSTSVVVVSTIITHTAYTAGLSSTVATAKANVDALSMAGPSRLLDNAKNELLNAQNALAQARTPSGFKGSLTRALSSVFTKVMAVINIISVIVMVVDLVMMLISIIQEDTTDTPYVEIPRVLCSVEDVFNGRYDENAGRIIEPGYVYYYGVKNPEIDRGDVNDKSNPYRYGIGDVYNWTLKGPYREWIALYTTKDQRMGNPIKAGSLFVSVKSGEEGSKTLEYFHSDVSFCDLMFYFRQTKGTRSIGEKYLHFATCTDEEMAALRTAGSVFSKAAPFAYGAIGLLVGAAGGIGIKALADKKKKKAAVEA